MKNIKKIRVVVANRYMLARKALSRVVVSLNDIEVVGEASDGQGIIEKVALLNPDIVIVDMNLSDITGGMLTNRIRNIDKRVKIISLNYPDREDYTYLANNTNVDAYISSEISKEELEEIIYRVANGQKCLPDEETYTIPGVSGGGMVKEGKYIVGDSLTDRESEIISCLAHGYSNEEIAQVLEISKKTVKCHLYNIYKKLSVKNRIQAILKALKLELCRLGDREWSDF